MEDPFISEHTGRLRVVDSQIHDTPDTSWLDEAATVPNAMTLFRLAMAPWAYHAVATAPKENWKAVGLVSLTDLEGNVARLGDHPRLGHIFRALRFRKSNIGEQGDPVADTVYGAAVAAGALKSDSMPRWLAKAMLVQKGVKSTITISAKARGQDLHVHNLGKVGEAVSAVGSYGCIAAEAIESPVKKRLAKLGGSVVAIAGLAASTLATVGLADEAGYIEAPRVSAALVRMNSALDRFVPGS